MFPSCIPRLRPSAVLVLLALTGLSSCADGGNWKTLKPQANAARELVSLDGIWNFALPTSIDLEEDKAWTKNIPPSLQIPVPASYNDIFADQNIRDTSKRRNILRFDAVTHEARVFINDRDVAGHIGGYTPFEVDVTDIVAPGEQFRLTVAVNNILTSQTIPPGNVEVDETGKRRQLYNHDFFNYAGIARSVSFYSVGEVYVDDITVTTEVKDQGKGATINFSATTNKDPKSSRPRVTLFDEEGNEVASASTLQGSLELSSVHLWQPGVAYLYRLRVELLSAKGKDTLLDSYEVSVGVRSVEVRGNEFLINGSPVYLTGFGKHEDSPVRGKGYDPAYMIHDFQLMKWIGANSFRTSHYPYAEEVMDYADRHGIVVIDEVPAVGLNIGLSAGTSTDEPTLTFSEKTINNQTREVHAQTIRELIHRDKNHASVVLWSLTNEPASNEEGARAYFEPLVELARELDPTRPMTFANVMYATPEADRIMDLFDVMCLNRYYGWYVNTGDLASAEIGLEQELNEWQDKYGKPIIMSEYGADTLAGTHTVIAVPWSEEYQTQLLQMSHRVFDRIESVVGEHVWNFAGFQTASKSIYRVDGNKKGVFTRDRKPKAAAHALRTRWLEEGVRKGQGNVTAAA
ncbi:related to b-glucuronidase [Cephalotrichum gorgonifer]|uniref:Beta-glucuronidase n=1 Tax=Cephalotrichum gorgonifer TaxID=2041049 RepID=A0AAE8SWH6_9PEZI|nr:related to b-glucuronidase [Cephalotrichum gorgonifer]